MTLYTILIQTGANSLYKLDKFKIKMHLLFIYIGDLNEFEC